MLRRADWRLLILGLVIADIGGVLLAFVAATSITGLRSPATVQYGMLAFAVAITPLACFAQGLYDPRNLLAGLREYAGVLSACVFGLLVVIVAAFFVREHISREWAVMGWAFALVILEATRFGIRRLGVALRRRGRFVVRALVVGADAQSVAVARQLGQPETGIKLLGFLDSYKPVGSTVSDGLKVLGSPSELGRIALRVHAEEAIVVPEALPWEALQDVLTDFALAPEGIQVHISAGFHDLLTTGVTMSERSHVPLLTVHKVALTPAEAALKRAMDLVLATLLLVAGSPVIAATAVWLRLRGSPLIERRLVKGRHGQTFKQLLFVASPGNSSFIRKLPALVNVLAGQLSLVGPRPIDLEEGLINRSAPPTIRPGLTGPWRQATDPTEQSVLDLYYVRNYSLWTDLHILYMRVKTRLWRGRKRPGEPPIAPEQFEARVNP